MMNGIPGIKPLPATFSVNEGGNASGTGQTAQKPMSVPSDVFMPSDPDSDSAITAEEVKLAATEAGNEGAIQQKPSRRQLHKHADSTYSVVDKETLNVEQQYNSAGEYHGGRMRVQKDGKWGFVDGNLSEVVEPKYDNVGDFSGGRAAVQKDGKWGFINFEGKEIVAPQYDSVRSFIHVSSYAENNNVTSVQKDGKWGLVNAQGQEIVAPQYDSLTPFKNDIYYGTRETFGFLAQKDGKVGLVNDQGKEIVKPQYDQIDSFSSSSKGLARVKKDGLYGFIDRNGVEVIKPQYYQAEHFQHWLDENKKPVSECRVTPVNGSYEEAIDANGTVNDKTRLFLSGPKPEYHENAGEGIKVSAEQIDQAQWQVMNVPSAREAKQRVDEFLVEARKASPDSVPPLDPSGIVHVLDLPALYGRQEVSRIVQGMVTHINANNFLSSRKWLEDWVDSWQPFSKVLPGTTKLF